MIWTNSCHGLGLIVRRMRDRMSFDQEWLHLSFLLSLRVAFYDFFDGSDPDGFRDLFETSGFHRSRFLMD